MPCRSDYLEATGREVGLKRAAQLAVFVGAGLGIEVPEDIAENAEQYYGSDYGQVQWLCGKLKNMSDADRERIVYDAHNAKSRDLADWWEEHQEADAKREAAEQRAAHEAALRASAASKLSDEERRAIGL